MNDLSNMLYMFQRSREYTALTNLRSAVWRPFCYISLPVPAWHLPSFWVSSPQKTAWRRSWQKWTILCLTLRSRSANSWGLSPCPSLEWTVSRISIVNHYIQVFDVFCLIVWELCVLYSFLFCFMSSVKKGYLWSASFNSSSWCTRFSDGRKVLVLWCSLPSIYH